MKSNYGTNIANRSVAWTKVLLSHWRWIGSWSFFTDIHRCLCLDTPLGNKRAITIVWTATSKYKFGCIWIERIIARHYYKQQHARHFYTLKLKPNESLSGNELFKAKCTNRPTMLLTYILSYPLYAAFYFVYTTLVLLKVSYILGK